MTENKAVFWDFDGTLAHRNGFFSEVLLEVLDEKEPGHAGTIDQIRTFLRGGFPWHYPDQAHLDLTEPKAWWDYVEATFVRAFDGLGLESAKAKSYAELSHFRYVDSSAFHLYDDTIEVLSHFAEHGWKNFILSNHVPDLPSIVSDLGLDRYVEDCISSANVGYEKPNPAIFRIGLKRAANPKTAWMVGDNYAADVAGAAAVGLPGVLVRRKPTEAEATEFYSDDLIGTTRIIR